MYAHVHSADDESRPFHSLLPLFKPHSTVQKRTRKAANSYFSIDSIPLKIFWAENNQITARELQILSVSSLIMVKGFHSFDVRNSKNMPTCWNSKGSDKMRPHVPLQNLKLHKSREK